jgi:tetratricopeptide (TPR) repeat protein
MSRARFITLLLGLITLIVYLPVGSHAFLDYDDNDYITDNPQVANGLNWPDFRWAFTTFHAGNWHPLTWLSHQADCQLLGANAGAQHFVSVLIHAANAVLLFLLLLRLGDIRSPASARKAEDGTADDWFWPAAFIAALFAWHPLHVESVAWLAERKDVLSMLFGLLALLSYVRRAQKRLAIEDAKAQGVKTPSVRAGLFEFVDYWPALLFFTLGLMCKPMVVTLPFVLLLLDFWPLRRPAPFQALLAEKWPFFLLAAASCVITFIAQKHGDAVVSLQAVPLASRLENAPVAVVGYLLNLLWPSGLCVLYPLPEKIPAGLVFLSLAVLIAISVLAWRYRRTAPWLLLGWLWFLGTLVPVIGLVQVGGQAMADRYTYLPSIGFFIAVAFLLRALATRLDTPRMVSAGAAAVLLIGCILATEFQLSFWRDSETLFRRAIAVTRHNDIALINLGVALEEQHRYEEALGFYRQAEQLNSRHFQLHNDLGHLLGRLGRHPEALAEYQAASRERPDDAVLHNALGSELAALGQFAAAQGELSRAEQLDPHYAWPHMEAAGVYFKEGRDADATNELQAAVQLDPGNFEILAAAAHYLAANENAAARDGKTALALVQRADDLSGHNQPMVLDVLGMALAETGDFSNAQICAQNAITLATAAQMDNLDDLHRRLELYERHQPWRESFLATNTPSVSR